MLYKHWKKLALALTGFFWAGCEDSSSSAECLYGPPEDYGISSPGEDESSSASEGVASSGSVEPNSSSSLEIGIMPLYGVRVFESSSSTDESSSSIENSSSSEGEIIAPAYGVYDKVVCYDTSSDKQTLTREQEDAVKTLQCENGVTCQERTSEHWESEFECIEDICPDYGVVKVSEKTYTCNDGNVYNEAQFESQYFKKSKANPTSSSSQNVEGKSSDSKFDEPIAVYGPPCYFDGTCHEDKE